MHSWCDWNILQNLQWLMCVCVRRWRKLKYIKGLLCFRAPAVNGFFQFVLVYLYSFNPPLAPGCNNASLRKESERKQTDEQIELHVALIKHIKGREMYESGRGAGCLVNVSEEMFFLRRDQGEARLHDCQRWAASQIPTSGYTLCRNQHFIL